MPTVCRRFRENPSLTNREAMVRIGLAASLPPFVLIAAVSGCGEVEGRFAVGGSVSYDGKPIPEGTISFVPPDVQTRQAAGTEISNGAYAIAKAEGLEPGDYRVVIYAERPSGRKIEADEGSSEMIDEPEQYIPPMYNALTKLTVEISADRSDLNFDLEAPPTRRRRR